MNLCTMEVAGTVGGEVNLGRGAAPAAGHPVRRIAEGEAVSLPLSRGGRIECVDGDVWVTQEDCGKDVVLAAGQSFSSLGRGKVVVQGLSKAAVAVWPW